MAKRSPMSVMFYNRLIRYLRFMKELPRDGGETISSTAIAAALQVNDVQVRKDLASVSSGGKPKIGYVTQDLIADLEHFLGHDSCYNAALAGVGNLGRALLSYENLARYGLKIVAAFDSDPALEGRCLGGVTVASAAKMTRACRRLHIPIGIITVPADQAQPVCDALLAGGVRAIWNFAPVHLSVPERTVVRNEDMAASLAILTRQLAESMALYGI